MKLFNNLILIVFVVVLMSQSCVAAMEPSVYKGEVAKTNEYYVDHVIKDWLPVALHGCIESESGANILKNILFKLYIITSGGQIGSKFESFIRYIYSGDRVECDLSEFVAIDAVKILEYLVACPSDVGGATRNFENLLSLEECERLSADKEEVYHEQRRMALNLYSILNKFKAKTPTQYEYLMKMINYKCSPLIVDAFLTIKKAQSDYFVASNEEDVNKLKKFIKFKRSILNYYLESLAEFKDGYGKGLKFAIQASIDKSDIFTAPGEGLPEEKSVGELETKATTTPVTHKNPTPTVEKKEPEAGQEEEPEHVYGWFPTSTEGDI